MVHEHQQGNSNFHRPLSGIIVALEVVFSIILDQKKMRHLVSAIENFAVVQNQLQIFSTPFQPSNQQLEVDSEMFLEHLNQPKRVPVSQNVSVTS